MLGNDAIKGIVPRITGTVTTSGLTNDAAFIMRGIIGGSRKVKILGRPANASLYEDWNWQRDAISVDSDGTGPRFPAAAEHNAHISALVIKRGAVDCTQPPAVMRCSSPFPKGQVKQLVGSNNAPSHPVVPGIPRHQCYSPLRCPAVSAGC